MLIREKELSNFADFAFFGGSASTAYMTSQNKLFETDLSTGGFSDVIDLPARIDKQVVFEKKIICKNGKTYLFYDNPFRCYVFDSLSHYWNDIRFGDSDILPSSYSFVLVHGEVLYVFAIDMKSVVIIDTLSGKYRIINNAEKKISSEFRKNKKEFAYVRYTDAVINANTVLVNAATNNGDAFVRLSLENMDVMEIIDTKLEGRIFGTLIQNDYLFFYNCKETENKIVMWDIENKEVVNIWSLEPLPEGRGFVFGKDGKIVFWHVSGKAFMIDLYKNDGVIKISEGDYYVGDVYETGEYIFANDKGFYYWDIVTNQKQSVNIRPLDIYITMC